MDFVVQVTPYVLMFVNFALSPFEALIQKKYWDEARHKIHALKPTIIGITGSFGKTSIKHILGHILSTKYETLLTPGSVNTAMGITRIVREQLLPEHKYFIVEMGAYGVGSIRSLCDLAPPDYGILSSIGHAHYERFGSLDNVAKAKSELSEAVLSKDVGKMIIHERTLKFPYVRKMRNENSDRFISCGVAPEVDPHKRKDISYLIAGDVQILAVHQTVKGLDISFVMGEKTRELKSVPIYGLHHGHNVVLAVVMAMELGMSFSDIELALKSLPQISHRLELKPVAEGGYTLIDDAYNSNPIGFRSALDLMATIGDAYGRKVLITPGMIELGIAHDDAHAQVGEYAGSVCDVVVVVCPKRIPTFVNAVKAKGKTLVQVDNLGEALEWLETNQKENDLVLIENDLPDMYECIPRM